MALYADVIIDISHEELDRTFQYIVPDELVGQVKAGCQVNIPFGNGNTIRKGYVIGITNQASYDVSRMKSVESVSEDGLPVEGRLLSLAAFIKEKYGSTMINAIQTVMPVKKSVKPVSVRYAVLTTEDVDTFEYKYLKKNAKAKLRLLRALAVRKVMPVTEISSLLMVSSQTLKAMESEGVLKITQDITYRSVLPDTQGVEEVPKITLSEEQQRALDEFELDYKQGKRETYLLHGVTGSGKTEVYVRCIQKVIEEGKQAIVLIPEIALTYQTVRYFSRYFKDRVTVVNSKLSMGEKYDQFERAKKGEVDVVIGPRSALFTPFERLGLIIIDEEHEGTYKSDMPPKYHAREVAIERARMDGASVILGSATPSVFSYKKAMSGEFKLWTLKKRALDRPMAQTSIVDLREELRRGNRSIISTELAEDIADRLSRKEQIMLFINKRGYNSFVSCRSCGDAIMCPHCDVALTKHITRNDIPAKLICHYCGYKIPAPSSCPSCGSKLIGGYGVGTEKVEEEIGRLFPGARLLRMDRDTTNKKDSYEMILGAFSRGEADILIGTQMIVKGHDFKNVTLVGILLADLTLFGGDYRAGERTFDLVAQAAGRAGRGSVPGKVVIQTYKPENYAILSAAKQDYGMFYETEESYRSLLRYPPVWNMMVVMVAGTDKEQLANIMDRMYSLIRGRYIGKRQLALIGPAEPAVPKIKDVYRQVLYVKDKDYDVLVEVKDYIEQWLGEADEEGISVFFDFNPLNMY